MHVTDLLRLLPLLSLSSAQAAAGGGGLVATMAPTQAPTVTQVTSIQTVGGSTVGVAVEFTQTFATTALGTWPLGTEVRKGTIGLGDIVGSVGGAQRAL
jgi:hypothetical protein